MPGTLVAVCAVHKLHDGHSRAGPTAIDKRPLAVAVRIEPSGVLGDRQIEESHGGRNQALYAYAREEAARWADEVGFEIPPGSFGENLATSGLPVTDAVVGERWRIGRTVVVETTMPRTPCATFQSWMGQPQWVKRFTQRGDVGSYLRVLIPGTVRAGDRIEVIARPAHGVTIREVFNAAEQDPRRLRRLLDEADDLAPKTAVQVRRALAAAGAP
ncbi:MAG TPA: MOSC domain-containing protein [Pseudonocardiaceae bacterium]